MCLRQLLVVCALSSVASLADASTYTLMFERDTDASGGLELAFLSYDSYDNLLGNTGALTTFSPINVAPAFTTSGLMYGGALPPPDPGGDPTPAVIPLPASVWMVLGALGLLDLRGRPWRCPPPAARALRARNASGNERPFHYSTLRAAAG